MLTQFFSIAFISLLGAMAPGPDFAIVTKNTLVHNKQAGFFTALGIGAAILVHMSYCVLGLAWVISSSHLIFNSIKYLGAGYLIYLGWQSFSTKETSTLFEIPSGSAEKKQTDFTAFKQGFLCNLLNPKATLFFLSLFTVVIKPNTPFFWQLIYALEICLLATAWFCCLTMILSHPTIQRILEKSEKYIVKLLGLFLIGFGITLVFIDI